MGKLKIYTDENVDVRVAEGLRRRGVLAFSALAANENEDVEDILSIRDKKASHHR